MADRAGTMSETIRSVSSGATQHERDVCRTVVRLLCRVESLTTTSIKWAEPTDSSQKNVEGVFAIAQGVPLLVEHTTVEAFPRQFTKDRRFERLAHDIQARANLRQNFGCRLWIDVDYDDRLGAGDIESFTAEVVATFHSVLDTLARGHAAHLRIMGVDVTVTRSRHWGGDGVRVGRMLSPGRTQDGLLAKVIRRLLDAKARKFDGKEGRRVLILEHPTLVEDIGSISIAAESHPDLLRLFDDIFIVDTDRHRQPWFVCPLQIGGKRWTDESVEAERIESDAELLTP